MKACIFIFFAFLINTASAQTNCGFDLKQKKNLISNQQEVSVTAKSTGTIYIIPVVFHVLYDSAVQNISDAQICDAIAVLNEDFRKQNYDTAYTIPEFKSIAADAEIEFRLATIDPLGNPTNGIDRINTMLTYNANDSSKINQWPPNQYLNIWTVDSLAIISGIYGVKAYAYGPAYASAYPQHDGILIRHNCVGRFGSGDMYQPTWARIITHEMGHYFNLLHIWGNSFGVGTTCSGDDLVSDTPVTKGSLWCSNLYLSTCSVLDNVQNYMNYSYCYTMFTQGQVDRMRATAASSVAGRNNLWSASNLLLTGTNIFQPCFASGIKEEQTENLNIFPNPTSGKFQLNMHLSKTATINIYNSIGQLILQQAYNSTTIDLSSSPKGMYFIKIIDGEKNYCGKVIVE